MCLRHLSRSVAEASETPPPLLPLTQNHQSAIVHRISHSRSRCPFLSAVIHAFTKFAPMALSLVFFALIEVEKEFNEACHVVR